MQNTLKNPWIIFTVTTFGVSLGAIDAGIVNVALPTITKYFHEDISSAQWAISGYLLVICAFLPLFGRLSDLYTKRTIYLLGLSVFTVSSFLCGIAFSMNDLIIYRLLQGIGSAMMFSNNQAIIVSNFPKNQIGRALGVNAMAFALGSIAGPSLGGFLVDALSWRSIFYINVPIGIAACCIGYFIVPRNENKKYEPIDIWGFALFAIGITLLLIILGNAHQWHWSRFYALGAIVVDIVILAVFIWHELKTPYPMTNLGLFKINPFRIGNTVSLLAYMGIATNSLLLPFCLQDEFGLSPSIVGVFLFIPPLLMMIFSPICGYLSDYLPKKILIIIGLLAIACGMFIEAYIPAFARWWFVVLGQALVGFGFAFVQSPINSSILGTVPNNEIGIASSIASLVRNLGKVFGTCLTVMVFQAMSVYWVVHFEGKDKHSMIFALSFRAVFILAAVLSIIATMHILYLQEQEKN